MIDWTGAATNREKKTWPEWQLIKDALIVAEGAHTRLGHTYPPFSGERATHFAQADEFRALFDKISPSI